MGNLQLYDGYADIPTIIGATGGTGARATGAKAGAGAGRATTKGLGAGAGGAARAAESAVLEWPSQTPGLSAGFASSSPIFSVGTGSESGTASSDEEALIATTLA